MYVCIFEYMYIYVYIYIHICIQWSPQSMDLPNSYGLGAFWRQSEPLLLGLSQMHGPSDLAAFFFFDTHPLRGDCQN